MTETNSSTHSKTQRTIPADAQNAAFLFTSTFQKETQRVLEDGVAAMEKNFAEYERGLNEMNRMAVANMKLMHEASRSLFAGFSAMLNASKNGQV